jgi:hypothetical protein
MSNESSVLTCDSNAFYSNTLNIVEITLWDFDDNIELYELIN